MKAGNQQLVFENLLAQYQHFGLSTARIDVKSDFTIQNLAYIHQELPFKSPVYRANFFSFVFVKEGEGKYTTDHLQFESVPGTIYFTNPGHYKSHEWFSLKAAFLITLSESFLKENVHVAVFDEFPFLLAETVAPRVLAPEQFAEFEQLYQQIDQEYQRPSRYRNRIIGSLFMVLLLKIKTYFWEDYNPIAEGNRGSQIVNRFKLLLEQHYRDLRNQKSQVVFRVQDYANAQGLHPNYLSNVIKSKTGKPIGAWIAEKTIAEAKSMLQHTAISIKEIAFILGFMEATHFSNYFKKHTGVSPLRFKKHIDLS